jgi:hypothetical protein
VKRDLLVSSLLSHGSSCDHYSKADKPEKDARFIDRWCFMAKEAVCTVIEKYDPQSRGRELELVCFLLPPLPPPPPPRSSSSSYFSSSASTSCHSLYFTE